MTYPSNGIFGGEFNDDVQHHQRQRESDKTRLLAARYNDNQAQ